MKTKTKPAPAPQARPPVALPASCDVLLSSRQVCAALGGISRRTFGKLLSDGTFPRADTRLGALPRWWSRSVNAWMESRCSKDEG